MEYIVLRKRDRESFPGFVPSGAYSTAEDGFSISVETAAECDAAGQNVTLKVPVMPVHLIQPESEEPAPASLPAESWGIGAVKASASGLTGEGVTVAVLDTGIQKDHPAFQGVDLITRNFTDGPEEDVQGHGTHCAGTIFGRDVGGCRIGVARGVRRALIGKVIGPGSSTGSVVKAISWALENGAHVVSMSLGIDYIQYKYWLEQELLFPDKIATSRALAEYASSARLFDNLSRYAIGVGGGLPGALLVAATGNASSRAVDKRFTVTLSPPALGEGVVAVGALQRSGDAARPYAIAPFSNTGPRLAAPGVGILSARLGGGVASKSGTSMATPHVAGVAALWAQKILQDGHPVTASQLVLRLERSARQLDGLAFEDVGIGLVQAP
jgi:subtilisin family serine protease